MLLENMNIENNIIEFALARLVAQLLLWWLLCDYTGEALKRIIYSIHLLNQFGLGDTQRQARVVFLNLHETAAW